MQPSAHIHGRADGRVELLGVEHHDEVRAMLERDIPRNLFMLSWAENYGLCAPTRPDLFHYCGLRVGGRLAGVVLVITDRLTLLDVLDEAAARRLGEHYREGRFHFEHVVSARNCVGPVWDAYASGGYASARLDREQELYVLDRELWEARGRDLDKAGATPDPGGEGHARLARPDDVDAVFWASARMHAEETLEDPLERDADHFRRHVEHRIDHDRTYVWFDDHRRLLFKADVSAQSGYGAQISGVYTPPALRGRGLATRGMIDICQALFDRGFPRITLYVNRDNEAARRVYQKVGFVFHAPYQTVFVEDFG